MAKLRALSLVTVDDILADYADTDVTATELSKLGSVSATTTELNYLDGVTSAIQTQLGGGGSKWSNNIVTAAGSNDLHTTSTGYVDLGNAAITISPTSQSSRIMLIMRHAPHLNNYNIYRNSSSQLLRGNTVLDQWMQMRIELQGSGNMYNDKHTTTIGIDHPNTTSAVTYKWQGKVNQSSANMYFHHSFNGANAIRMMAIEINSGQSVSWT